MLRGASPLRASAARRSTWCVTGAAELQVERGRVHPLEAGDFVLLPNAAPHVVRSGRGAQFVPFDDWLALHPMDAAGRSVHAGSGAVTRVIGGFFSTGGPTANPLFAALPRVIVLRGSDARVRRWLEPTLAFIENEIDARAQGAAAVLQRMADVLFIQAVRAYAGQDEGDRLAAGHVGSPHCACTGLAARALRRGLDAGPARA